MDPLHATTVACTSFEATQPLVLPKLQAWLQALVTASHDGLYRIKGVLSIEGHDERFVLHGIHAQIQGQFERPWGYGEPRHSVLVIIAHRSNQKALESGFRACVLHDPAESKAPFDAWQQCGETMSDRSDSEVPSSSHPKSE